MEYSTVMGINPPSFIWMDTKHGIRMGKSIVTGINPPSSVLMVVNHRRHGHAYLPEPADRRRIAFAGGVGFFGYLYGFSGRHEYEGELRCLDLKTGDVKWKTPDFEKNSAKIIRSPITGEIKDDDGRSIFGRGSKIQMGDRFLVLGEWGTLALIKVRPDKFEEIGRRSVPGIKYPAWAAPVLSRGRVYLRSETHLVCLDLAEKSKSK